MAETYGAVIREYLGELEITELPIEIIGASNELDKAVCRHRVVAILFSSPACPACAAYRPIFYQYASRAKKKYEEGKVGFYEANVYDLLEKAWELGITATPTTIIFENCKPVDAVVGLVDEDSLDYIVSQYIEDRES